MRTTSSPAWIMAARISSLWELGPNVATTFVRFTVGGYWTARDLTRRVNVRGWCLGKFPRPVRSFVHGLGSGFPALGSEGYGSTAPEDSFSHPGRGTCCGLKNG